MELTDAAAVARFQTYLRMKTVHPDPTAGYVEMGAFLKERAAAIGLELEQLELVPGHLLYILKWAGSHPELGSVVLNSHMDVVPVDADKWTKDPWAAEIIDGKIYGRGTQVRCAVRCRAAWRCAHIAAAASLPRARPPAGYEECRCAVPGSCCTIEGVWLCAAAVGGAAVCA